MKEIDDMQNEQMNIKNQINMIKDKNINMQSNIPNININNNTNNININNNTNNIYNNTNNINNNGNKNYNINMNQSGIGPSKNIIDFNPINLPQNTKDNKNDEYNPQSPISIILDIYFL